MNITNLITSLQQAATAATTPAEYAILSKAIQKLNVGKVTTVASLGSISANSSNAGNLFYVVSEEEIYYSTGQTISLLSGVTTAIYAWGRNAFGNVGDNATTNRSSPVTVVGNITSWSKISSGYHHNFAINSGVAYAWGSGGGGQLGNNADSAKSSPVTVVGGITTWSQVSASGGPSGQHSLGITSAGIAYAWGYNGNGQLGDGTTTSRSSPVTVVGGITTWSQVSGGGFWSLGRTSAGILYVWGGNNYGQLGDGTTAGRSSPVTVVGGITTWSQVDGASKHSLGLTSAGVLYAWGANYGGQLGDNTGTSRSSPVTVVGGITTWNQVSGGQAQSIALTSAGVLYAWGTNSDGQLGDGTTTSRSSPVTVVGGITTWSQISAGLGGFSGGLTSAGVLYAWGNNSYGKLGDGTASGRSSPVTVVGGITTWSQISAGGQQFLALRTFS